jgi:oligoribonuclease NrnB/cAMP/cGMP phosphodiesterase (DHH superfamily)
MSTSNNVPEALQPLYTGLAVQPTEVQVFVYHGNCNDGTGAHMSARILLGNNAEYVPAWPQPWSGDERSCWSRLLVHSNTVIAFGDICPPIALYNKLKEQGNRIVILDHHKTNRDDMAAVPNTDKVFHMDYSGARLCWHWFHQDKPLPRLIELIEKRDLWRKDEPAVDQLFEYLLTLDHDWERYSRLLDAQEIAKGIEIGAILISKKDSEVPSICERSVIKLVETKTLQRKYVLEPLQYGGYVSVGPSHNVSMEINHALVAYVNTDSYISDVGNHLIQTLPVDYAAVWFYRDRYNETKFSLRSDDRRTDISVIAKAHRGGGHRNAAGCTLNGLVCQLPGEHTTIHSGLVKLVWDDAQRQRRAAFAAFLKHYENPDSKEQNLTQKLWDLFTAGDREAFNWVMHDFLSWNKNLSDSPLQISPYHSIDFIIDSAWKAATKNRIRVTLAECTGKAKFTSEELEGLSKKMRESHNSTSIHGSGFKLLPAGEDRMLNLFEFYTINHWNVEIATKSAPMEHWFPPEEAPAKTSSAEAGKKESTVEL